MSIMENKMQDQIEGGLHSQKLREESRSRLNKAPFYPGQRVLAFAAQYNVAVKNGKKYRITYCDYTPSSNPIANGKSFWYIKIDKDWEYEINPAIFKRIEYGAAKLQRFKDTLMLRRHSIEVAKKIVK